MSSLLTIMMVFPFDPSIDTPLGHRNLISIYVVVWLVQMGYGAYALHTWRKSGRRPKLD
jgi:hypothetical protein